MPTGREETQVESSYGGGPEFKKKLGSWEDRWLGEQGKMELENDMVPLTGDKNTIRRVKGRREAGK